MQIGIDERDPAHRLGTLARTAVADQAGLGRRIGDVTQDRGVLGQHEIAIHQHRHRTGRIQRQEFRRLQPLGIHDLGCIRLAGPFQDDMVRR